MTAILLTAGKRMARNLTEVSIHFKPTPHLMFPGASDGPAIAACWCSNCSRTRASDKRGRPRSQVRSELGQDEVSLRRSVGVEEPPRAYAWLLLDVMQGDQTLFARGLDRQGLADCRSHRRALEIEPPHDFPNYRTGARIRPRPTS